MRNRLFILLTLTTCCAAESVLAADISVWAAPEGFKIDKFGKKIFVLDPKQDLTAIKKKNGIWDAEKSTITIGGARGETVAFQLGIEGADAGLKQVDVKAGKLSGPGAIPESSVELFKMYYTQLTDKGSGPTNGPTMGQGWYPDALVPWSLPTTASFGGYNGPPFPVAAGEIQGVWIDIAIPYGVKAGSYSAELTVSAADCAPKVLKLALKVYDFDIPRKIHNTFFMNFSISELSQAGGYWLKGDKATTYENDVYQLARKHRFTAGNMYNNERPKIEETPEGELKSTDWTAYDAHYDKVLNAKKNIFGPGEDAIEIWKVPLVTSVKGTQWPKGNKAWDQMIGEIKKHWQEKNWDLSHAYAYLADEPPQGETQKLREYAQRVKDAPGLPLRRQIAVYTILGNAWDKQKPIFDLWKDSLDMWMVAGDYYHVEDMNNLPSGCLKGQYQGGEPYQGNETLDADGVAMRTWSWIAWQYRIDYQCYYAMDEAWRGLNKGHDKTNCEIWDQPRNRKWAVSQGVFIYPGRRVDYDHPIVNIRMKAIRRGQTDFEYFWLLRQAGEEKLADSLAKGVVHAALSEGGPAPEAYGYGKWSHNPEDWNAAIISAAAKLEELKGKLPKEPATLEAK